MRFSNLLTARCSSLFIVVFAVLLLSVGCGGNERAGEVITPTTGSITLTWQAPETNEDESPLTDLAGFNVYCGRSAGTYIQIIDVGYDSTPTISLSQGTWFISVRAYDNDGYQSEYSNEISVNVTSSS